MFKLIYIQIIVPLAILLPILLSLYNYQKLSKALKIVFYYLLISGSINVFAIILAKKNISNLPLLHFYTAFEFAIVCLFYKEVSVKQENKPYFNYLIISFIIFCLFNVFFLQKDHSYNTYSRTIESLIFIFLSLKYVFSTNNNNHLKDWKKDPNSWINFSFLIYFSSSLFLFSFTNILESKKNKDLIILAWDIHGTFVLIMYILITTGIVKNTCRK